MLFFLLAGLGNALEVLFKRVTGRFVGGFAGWFWTFAWSTLTGKSAKRRGAARLMRRHIHPQRLGRPRMGRLQLLSGQGFRAARCPLLPQARTHDRASRGSRASGCRSHHCDASRYRCCCAHHCSHHRDCRRDRHRQRLSHNRCLRRGTGHSCGRGRRRALGHGEDSILTSSPSPPLDLVRKLACIHCFSPSYISLPGPRLNRGLTATLHTTCPYPTMTDFHASLIDFSDPGRETLRDCCTLGVKATATAARGVSAPAADGSGRSELQHAAHAVMCAREDADFWHRSLHHLVHLCIYHPQPTEIQHGAKAVQITAMLATQEA